MNEYERIASLVKCHEAFSENAYAQSECCDHLGRIDDEESYYNCVPISEIVVETLSDERMMIFLSERLGGASMIDESEKQILLFLHSVVKKPIRKNELISLMITNKLGSSRTCKKKVKDWLLSEELFAWSVEKRNGLVSFTRPTLDFSCDEVILNHLRSLIKPPISKSELKDLLVSEGLITNRFNADKFIKKLVSKKLLVEVDSFRERNKLLDWYVKRITNMDDEWID